MSLSRKNNTWPIKTSASILKFLKTSKLHVYLKTAVHLFVIYKTFP